MYVSWFGMICRPIWFDLEPFKERPEQTVEQGSATPCNVAIFIKVHQVSFNGEHIDKAQAAGWKPIICPSKGQVLQNSMPRSWPEHKWSKLLGFHRSKASHLSQSMSTWWRCWRRAAAIPPDSCEEIPKICRDRTGQFQKATMCQIMLGCKSVALSPHFILGAFSTGFKTVQNHQSIWDWQWWANDGPMIASQAKCRSRVAPMRCWTERPK